MINFQFKDLLQLMIEATDESSGRKLSDEQIVAFARGFLIAGYETTASALACTAYLLALHPQVQERLCSEIDSNQVPKAHLHIRKLYYHKSGNFRC